MNKTETSHQAIIYGPKRTNWNNLNGKTYQLMYVQNNIRTTTKNRNKRLQKNDRYLILDKHIQNIACLTCLPSPPLPQTAKYSTSFIKTIKFSCKKFNSSNRFKAKKTVQISKSTLNYRANLKLAWSKPKTTKKTHVLPGYMPGIFD